VSEIAQQEEWVDEESATVWRRESDRFSLVTRNGAPIDPHWENPEIGAALGCGCSTDVADGASMDSPAYFPPAFARSPNTGKLLPRYSVTKAEWLPPSGSQELKAGLIRGGKLTHYSVRLRDGYAATDAYPPRHLKLPPPGRYRFLVGSFGLNSSFLMAFDALNGAIWCWIPSCTDWREVKPSANSDKIHLGSEDLSQEAWNVDAIDLARESKILWPCDSALVCLYIDPLALTYTARVMAEGRCHAQPLVHNEHVYCLMENNGHAMLVEVSVDAPYVGRDCAVSFPIADWRCAVATHNGVIWVSSKGQVIANPKRNQYAFVPWQPEAIQPEFDLGPPYCASDGRLWMQVLHPIAHEGEEGPAYLSLGRPTVDLLKSSGMRTLTGRSSIKVEQRLLGDPWIEPEVVSSDGHFNDEAVIPILESMTDNSMLVLRANHIGSIKDFLQLDELIPTRFQIMGQHGDHEAFFSTRVRAPWRSMAFVFDGALFLYHSEFKSIMGWVLASSNSEKH